MNKETEELLIIGVGLFFLFSIMGGSSASALSLAKINATSNTAYAGDATSVLNTALNDWS